MRKRSRVRFACILSLASAAFPLQESRGQYNVGGWFPNWEGIEYAEGTATSPRLMKAFALRISLRNPDIQTIVTPSNGGLPYETTKQTTPEFLDVNNLKAAINGGFFDTSTGATYTDNIGAVISNGNLVSDSSGWAKELILFTEDKTPWLNYYCCDPTGWRSGVAGNTRMLINGVPNTGIPGEENQVHPRTAAGISQDGKYLYFVVVDGRQAGWSNGATFWDMGNWCKAFGAWSAVNLDGGGSSCMALRNVFTGAANVMNRPSDGSPRKVGANLGLISAPMGLVGPAVESMNANRIDMVFRANQNAVGLKTWTSAGGWVVDGLGGVTYDTPAIVSRGPGLLDVFIRGTDNALWHKAYNGTSWGSWVSYGGTLSSGPSACSRNANNWEVVYRGPNNNVWFLSWNSGVFDYGNLGATTYDRPAIVARGSNDMNIFIRGTDNAMWYNWHNGSTWNSWSSLGGYLTSAPAATSRNSQNLEVVYRGGGDDLWYLSWNNPNWSYGSLGNSVAGCPAITSADPNTATVYIRGTDDRQYMTYFQSGVGWMGWADQGPFY